jgi:hypothetical protein
MTWLGVRRWFAGGLLGLLEGVPMCIRWPAAAGAAWLEACFEDVELGLDPGALDAAKSISAACCPASLAGTATLVREGVAKAASSMSSKPVTRSSDPTVMPSSAAASMTPRAMTSL